MQRVIALEAEVARLRDEVESIRAAATDAVADTHRQYRRDLVPLHQEVVLYQSGRRRKGR